jgi:hypothetical protein
MKLPKALNEAEERLAMQLKAYGTPFEREYLFASPRKWRFDFALPDKIAVEIEGGIFSNGRHVRPRGFIADIEKYNQAAIFGWRLLRYTSQQVRSGLAIEQLADLVKNK